jgi:hypothetical protein
MIEEKEGHEQITIRHNYLISHADYCHHRQQAHHQAE